MEKSTILIAGAGLGGLCLAQALRRAGIDVQVFERDKGPWDRPQGYRLHIDSDGMHALAEALPTELWQLFEATSMKPLPFTTIVNTSLGQLRRVPSDDHGGTNEGPAQEHVHANVNRATLRQILLTGLEDVVHFGEQLTRYESDDAGVTAFFETGKAVGGDVLVGADGIRSSVRKQRFPGARMQDTGVRAIYGRLPMERALELLPQQALSDVFTVAVDEKKLFLGLGPVLFPMRPELASSALMPKARLREQDDYVVCIVGGRLELFGHDDAALRQFSSEALKDLSEKVLGDWPAATRAIPAHGDPKSFFFVEMSTSVPTTLPGSGNVTLLGDAVHAMTPTLGRGANIAMRDAAQLAGHLRKVFQGGAALADALRDYEAEMTKYGFDAVRESAAMGAKLMGQNPLPE